MRESFQKLLNVAYDLMVFFGRSSFEVHTDDESAFVDIKVTNEFNPGRLWDLANGHRVNIYPAGDYILVRVYEN